MTGLLPFVIILLVLTIFECILFYKQKTYKTLSSGEKIGFWFVMGFQLVLGIGIAVALIYG